MINFVVFDVETTGTDPRSHEITQIAAIAVEKWEEVDCFTRKVRFNVERADQKALEVNHFDPAIWEREAVSQETAAREFSTFLQRHASVRKMSKRTGRPYFVARLAGHNSRFDADFVERMFRAHDIYIPADIYLPLCTLQLALWHYARRDPMERPRDYKLGTLCEHIGSPMIGAHDALVDVRGTLALARHLNDIGLPPEQVDLL